MRRVVACVALAAVGVLAAGTARPAAAEELASGRGGSLTLTEQVGGRLYATSGSPGSGFSTLAPISPAGEDAGSADLASDSAGDVLAVWAATRLYLHSAELEYPLGFSLPRGIWYAWQRPGRTFSAAHELALPAVGQGVPLVAMNNAGEAAIAYEDRGAVYLRRARAGRPFGPAVIARAGRAEIGTAETRAEVRFLGIDDAGGLLIVTTRAGRLQARVAHRGQNLGAPQAIGPPSPERSQLGIAMNRAATAVIVWEGPSNGGLFAAYRMHGATRFGSPHRLTIPQSLFPRDQLADVAVDGHDRAIFALVGNPRVGPTEEGLSYPEVDAWDGHHAPPTPTPLGPGSQTGVRMSVAVNEAGDAAISYGQWVGYSLHGVVHLSTNDAPFGPALTLSETSSTLGGACFEVAGIPGNVIGCGGDTRLLGAAGPRFFAVTHLTVIPERDGLANVIEIRSFSKQGAEAAAYVSSPEATRPPSQPASVVDFGATAAADSHGRIHGQMECGSSEGACTIGIAIKEATASDRTLGRASVQVGGWERKPVALALNRLGLSRLMRRGRLPVRVVTETTGTHGPTVDTTYQLTIRGRHRR